MLPYSDDISSLLRAETYAWCFTIDEQLVRPKAVLGYLEVGAVP